jgi:AcrR family transcriptional regulator
VAEIETVRDLRRSQIVGAARKLVAEGGLESLTIGALESRLSFSRGVITYHFRNKEEIVHAVLDSAVEEINQAALSAIEQETSIEKKLVAMIHATLRGFLDHVEAAYILLAFWSRVPSDPKVAETNARLFSDYRAYAVELTRQGQLEGIFDPDLEPETVASLLVAIVNGTAAQVIFEPGAIDPEATAKLATDTVLARLTRR